MHDDLDNLLNVMTDRHPSTAPAHWPADDLDKLIDDFGTVAYGCWRSGDLIDWLISAALAMALRHARLWRKIRGEYR
jgi:hypothetical protein